MASTLRSTLKPTEPGRSTFGNARNRFPVPGVLDTEHILLACALAVLAGVAILVFSHGILHSDEPMCADMAINLTMGKGFVNNASDCVPPDTQWWFNMPVHAMTLAAWLSLLGTSRAAVISFNVAIYCLVAILLVRVLRILAPDSRSRLIWGIPLLVFCHPSSVGVYSINRYDALGCPLIVGAFLALFTERPWVRRSALAAIAAVCPWIGLQVAVAASALGVLAALSKSFLRRRSAHATTSECLGFSVLTVCSALLMLSLADSCGQLDERVPGRIGDSPAIPALVAKLAYHYLVGGKLASMAMHGIFPLVCALILFFCYALFTRPRSPGLANVLVTAGAALAINAAVSIPLGVLGVYYYRYTWLVVPSLLVAIGLCIPNRGLPAVVRGIGMVAMFGSALLGLPLSCIVSAIEWRAWDYATVEAFVSPHVAKDDVVYANFNAYYPVKHRADTSYFGASFGFLPTNQKSEIDLLVLQYPNRNRWEPDDATIFRELGDGWELVDELKVARGELRMQLPRKPKVPTTWNLRIFRRTKPSG